MLPEITLLEIILRVSSAISLTIASGLVWYLLYKHQLTPRPAWLHVASVIGLVALWRWVIVTFINPEFFLNAGLPDVATFLTPWVQPISQALYTLIGITIILLALVYRIGGKNGRY
jgi:hypothetical protein